MFSTPITCINNAHVLSRTAHEQHKTPDIVKSTNIRTRAMRTKLKSAVWLSTILLGFLNVPNASSTSFDAKESRDLTGE